MSGAACPQCGRPIPPGSPAGLCAACLLALGTAPDASMAPAAPALPRSLLLDGLRRIGWVGLALTLTAVGVLITGYFVQPGWINPATAPASYRWSVVGIALCGLALVTLSQLRWRDPSTALDLALVVEVLAGLCIALSENVVPYIDPIRSGSSVAVWITVFALAVPVRFGKALTAALATACMEPLGLFIQVRLLGNIENLPRQLWFILSVAPFLMAVASTLLGKLIYRLGTEVKAAREYGGYQLVERIGRGAMGEVWRARHHIVGREAAVKLIRPELFDSSSNDRLAAQRRFEREAQATASLHSPHTVALYNYGLSEDGLLYYVMELLDGFDLETLVTRFGPLPAARAVAILRQVCDSLAEAHEAGLIHRDIKPGNIVLTHAGLAGDFAKVVDFGLAQPVDGPGRSQHLIAGTPAYIAPEILAGGAPSPRTDIYSLGCIAYWLLTAKPVFEAATAPLTMQAHLTETPRPLAGRTQNPIPADLEALVLACLAKDPAARPATARELSALLEVCAIDPPWTRLDADRWWGERAL